MNTSRASHLSRLLMAGVAVLASLLLNGCWFSGSASVSNTGTSTNAGWVEMDYAWSDTQNAYLGGTAFISPHWWSCCTYTAQDTGVTVVWTNSTTGTSGPALQYVRYACFLSTCWPSSNTWSATIPLSQVSNSLQIKATDPDGNEGHYSLTMSPGTIFPSVVTTSPVKDASNASINASISATFNDTMDPTTFNTTTFQVRGNNYSQVAGTFAFNGNIVSFTPSASLSPNAWYFVQVAASVRNLQGNTMFHDYYWSFQTGSLPDTSSPSISSVMPANGATDVSAATTAEAGFSEAMDPATLNPSTFLLKDGANNPVNGTVAYSGNRARFTPADLPAPSTTYTATITTGAMDTSGNSLASDYNWSFTTGTSQQGALDANFGTGGVASIDNTVSTGIYGFATDGTWLYAAGYSNAQGKIEKRNLNDGSLDSGFGTNGVVDTAWNTAVYAIATDSTFMYLAEQDGTASPTFQWRIEKRYLSDGTLAAGFGSNGVVITAPSTYPFTDPKSIAIDADYMYAAGFVATSNTKQWRIEKRRLSDGSLVASFGTNGVVTSAQSSTYPVGDVKLVIDTTSIYVAGQGSNGGLIEKRNLSDGALDPAFGMSGSVTSPSNAYDSIAMDGTSLYVGSTTRLEKRSLADGALDTSFGTGGILDTSTGTGMYLSALVVDAPNLYLGGIDYFDSQEWRIEKRNLADGSFVSGFGTAGAVTSYPSSQPALNTMAISGAFLFAGGNGLILPDTFQWRIEKRHK